MKHNFKNVKWMPENETFVHVPNEQIPEVIQLLRDNGHPVWANEEQFFQGDENVIWFDHSSEWHSNLEDQVTKHNIELPFPDFKALVTGKLPESWCIQCTEESVKHEAWPRLIKSINGPYLLSGDSLGWYYYLRHDIVAGTIGATSASKPNCEVLQIETWAALNPVEESTEKWTPNEEEQKSISKDIRSVTQIGKSTDEQLINELKSRGYTVSKIY